MIDTKILIKNFSSLSLLQVSNYIFPLITFPYLLRVLGPDKYGLMNFAAAFAAYFGILIDYGFNLSIPREISIHRDDKNRLSQIFSSVIIIKTAMLLLSLIVFASAVILIPRFYSDKEIYFLSFIYVLGQALFPVWFFQGMEKMQFISIISIPVRALVVVLTFLLIHDPGDIYLLLFINNISFVAIGVLGFLFVLKNFNVKLKMQTFSTLKYYINEGFHLFISSISISLYTITNVFLLGLLAGDTAVGYFSAADKIRMAVQNMSYTVTQTVYPHAARIFNSSFSGGMELVKNIVKTAGSINFIICLLIFIFSDTIIYIIAGDSYHASVPVLRIISFLPFIIFLSNIAGIVVMLNTGYKQAFAGIVLTAAVLSVTLSFILVPIMQETGTSISVMITEVFVTAATIIFVIRKIKSGMVSGENKI